MKKTLLKNTIRTIQKNTISWLAIAIVVMMSYGVFFGTFFYADSIDEAIISYGDKTKFEDFNIMATAGLKEDEIEQLRRTEGILDLEGTWRISDSSLRFDGEENDVVIYGLTKRLSLPEILDGELPDRDGECALTPNVMKANGIHLGDRVELSYGGDIPDDLMKSNSFIVTAMVHHPDSLSSNYDDLVFLSEDAFDKEATDDNYSCIRVDADISEKDYTGLEEYKLAVGKIRDKVRADLGPIGRSHDIRTKDEANRKLDDARQEAAEKLGKAKRDIEKAEDKIEDAQKKLNKADKKLKDAEQKIADAEDEIEKNKKKLKDAKKKIKSGKKKIRRSEKKLRSAKKKINKGRKKLNKNKKKLSKAKKKLDKATRSLKKKISTLKKLKKAGAAPSGTEGKLKAAKKKLKAKKKEYKAKKKKFDKAKREFRSKEREYNRGRRKLKKGKSKLRSSKRKVRRGERQLREAQQTLAEKKIELEDKKKELAEKKIELEDARQELEDGKQEYREKKEETDAKIADAQKKIDDLKPSSYVFLTRTDMNGFAMLKEIASHCRNLGLVFVVIFSMVGVIVILSTIAILIDANKKLIGTMKSFGFRNNEIIFSYLIFTLTASIAGMLLSIGLAAMIEFVAIMNLGSFFIIQTKKFSFDILTYLLLFGLQLLIAGLVTVAGVIINATKYSPLALMDGSAGKKAMKKASGSTSGSSLYSRLILRNMKLDLARVLTSVIIISGSCFMMGEGITLRNAFFGMMPHSSDEIHHYQMEVVVSKRTSDEEYEKVRKYLEGKGISFAQICKLSSVYHYKDTEEFLNIISADESIYPGYIELTDMDREENYTPDRNGIMICNRIAEKTGLEPGEDLILYDEDYHPHTIRTDHICRNYLGRVIYLSRKDYREILGKEPVNNTFLIRTAPGERDQLKNDLKKQFSGLSVEYTDQLPVKLAGLSTIYNVIIIIVTLLSILLSVFVLLNLVNIFVRRRQNEVLIMAVNGFSWKEQVGYLLRETIMTTLSGLCLGVILGVCMTNLVIRIVESSDTMYVRSVNVFAWVFAVLLEAFFALVINVISYRSLKKMKLSDIN